MILDNKTTFEEQTHKTVAAILEKYIQTGTLDIVTGYFSIAALAWLRKRIPDVPRLRMILGELVKDEGSKNLTIDLLREVNGIPATLELHETARQAIALLQEDRVAVRTIQQVFCHAKCYLYHEKEERNRFYVAGSSNLTESGLGIRPTGNIELNLALTGNHDDYKNLSKWVKDLWENKSSDTIQPNPTEPSMPVNAYIIRQIEEVCRKYEPIELYYKVLYELFKFEIQELSNDADFRREVKRLEESELFQTLHPYQQKGALSLIKMLLKYNGAILADAVGLGKTWTALAVMRYFQSKGYTVVLLCPKKLEANWAKYRSGNGSRFDGDDLEYLVRFHTDLQDERLDKYADFPLAKIQKKQKVLFVIDESHNLRNDKSERYKFLVDKLLMPEKPSRDVKVLMLSATPINNGLMDVRNQFRLITRGANAGFSETDLEVDNLEWLFADAQKDFNAWSKSPERRINEFIATLPAKFFALTDALVVARTRSLIQGEFGKMQFPRKERPDNHYHSPVFGGELNSFDDILQALRVNLTAYRPSEYTYAKAAKLPKGRKQAQTTEPEKATFGDERIREQFLVKMMYILMVKRLESSWFSFHSTVKNILGHHERALAKVIAYRMKQELADIAPELGEGLAELIEEATTEHLTSEGFTLGKKNPVHLDEIADIDRFETDLHRDVAKLRSLVDALDAYAGKFDQDQATDGKLETLLAKLTEKQKQPNRKVIIFTAFSDTAEYLYKQLKARGIQRIACVTGSKTQTDDGYTGTSFEPVLERFAPYTKLYMEQDWKKLYEVTGTTPANYEQWQALIRKHRPKVAAQLDAPIDVLVATDCLSEGQNLQDCDMVINYDIHWNPVRLIQRMGRIDRLGSPNDVIYGVNFWPGQDYDDYLKLRTRVETRMALMTLMGSELQEEMTPELEKMVEENSLLPQQAEKMLRQLQDTWDDLETGDDTLGLDDLSLEPFRQELLEYFRQNEERFKRIPNGVFTGFKLKPLQPPVPDSLVAVLGYPRRPENSPNHLYSEILLMHAATGEVPKVQVLRNSRDILMLLRHHKNEARYVPQAIDEARPEALKGLQNAIEKWVKEQVPRQATVQLEALFGGVTVPPKITTNGKLEQKFQPENFDLITWFVLTA